MREERLLERISRWEVGFDRTNLTSAELLVNSILAHLSRILNTRQGSVPIDPAYGVPDFTNLAGSFVSGSTRDIENQIRRVVERYEPRLRHPEIHLVEEGHDVLSLRFELAGEVSANDRDIPVHLATTVTSDGKVMLER